MGYFVKAAEVWQLDLSGRFLVLSSASYFESTEAKMRDFQSTSIATRFEVNEGLPGKTWAARRPLLWTDLSTSHFKRSEVASIAGLVCGLSVPVYAGEFLLGIMVMFFAADDEACGAVEVWHNRDYYDNELRLMDGYYGDMEKFEFISRRLTIMRGRGLPGSAWDQSRPVIMTDLAGSSSFLRARNARECGITTGFAIPFFYTDRDVQVVNFFSTQSAPVANRIEIWRPDEAHRYLLFNEGYCIDGEDLSATYRGAAYSRGEDILGQVWFHGRPLVGNSENPGNNATLYIPVIIKGILEAVVRLTF